MGFEGRRPWNASNHAGGGFDVGAASSRAGLRCFGNRFGFADWADDRSRRSTPVGLGLGSKSKVALRVALGAPKMNGG
jgi:hypothetical protein